jgi:DNA-binding NarL/FixJ family response regulator
MTTTTSVAAFPGVHSISPIRPHPARSPAIRAVVADGQSLVRAGFRLLLEATEHIAVVGEAASGEEVVALARRLSPDVALIDARLPGLDSVAATRQISSEAGVKVMLLAVSGPDGRILAALRAGAMGLLLKDTEPDELVRAVEALARGEALLSPSITRRLISELASRPEPAHPSPDLLDELTAREREVMTLVGHGLDNEEIAERLVISLATAKTHVSRAMVKLGAHERARLVVFAYETGLVRPHAKQSARPELSLDRARERAQNGPAENAARRVSTSEQLGLTRTRV